MEDIRCAGDFIASFPGVDKERIGILGICGGNAADGMELIDQPLLMIAGQEADTYYMTAECYARATGTKDKELFLVPGASHIRTYFVPEYVDLISSKLTAFFSNKL